MPHLKPVGHQSTNWMVRLVLMVATAAFTSFGTTSPPQTCESGMSEHERHADVPRFLNSDCVILRAARYIMQHAMYLPLLLFADQPHDEISKLGM